MSARRTTPRITEDVADRIRRLIHSGALSPGDRLPPERELAAEWQVARVSVREGIRMLAEAGYLVVRRGGNGGTFVAQLDSPYNAWLATMRSRAGELDAILDLRIAVEGHAAFLAAQRRSEAELATLRQTLSDLVGSEDREAFRRADSQFHTTVAAAARSARLEEVVTQSRGEFFVPTDKLTFNDQVPVCEWGHRAVLVAIEERDAEAARAAMAEHIEDTRLHFHRVLRGNPLPRTRGREGRAS
jgi:DNA-binding FadR family transcriptional regulator